MRVRTGLRASGVVGDLAERFTRATGLIVAVTNATKSSIVFSHSKSYVGSHDGPLSRKCHAGVVEYLYTTLIP